MPASGSSGVASAPSTRKTGKSKPYGEKKLLGKLVKMGFEEGIAAEALAKHEGNIEAAVAAMVAASKKAGKKDPRMATAKLEKPKKPTPKPSEATGNGLHTHPEEMAQEHHAPAETAKPKEDKAEEPQETTNLKKASKEQKQQKEASEPNANKEKKERKEKKDKKDTRERKEKGEKKKDKKEKKDKKDMTEQKLKKQKHEEKDSENESKKEKKHAKTFEAPGEETDSGIMETPPAREKTFSPLNSEQKHVPDLNPQSLAKFFDQETYAGPRHKKAKGGETDCASKLPGLEKVATVASICSQELLSPCEKGPLPAEVNVSPKPTPTEASKPSEPAATQGPPPSECSTTDSSKASPAEAPTPETSQKSTESSAQAARQAPALINVGSVPNKRHPQILVWQARCLKLTGAQKDALNQMASPTAAWLSE